MKTTIDVKTGLVTSDEPGAVRNFISWRRLAEQLAVAKETRPRETITHFIIKDRGIEYAVKTP